MELEARWRCCCWTLVFAEVSLTLSPVLVEWGLWGKCISMWPHFFVVDHNWARQEENNTVSLQESGEAEQHQAWSLSSKLPLISPAAAFACQLLHFSLICS